MTFEDIEIGEVEFSDMFNHDLLFVDVFIEGYAFCIGYIKKEDEWVYDDVWNLLESDEQNSVENYPGSMLTLAESLMNHPSLRIYFLIH
jgi:hypothetical protein